MHPLIHKLFYRRNYSIGRALDREKIVNLIKEIRPKTFEQGLLRFGGEGDGGYLVPDDLIGIDAIFSPGVGVSSKFELELSKNSIPVYQVDGTIDQPFGRPPNFYFEKKNLGVVNDAHTIRLETWVMQHQPTSVNLLLQMDIEGAEYPVILDTPMSVLQKFRIILIEFHLLDGLFNKTLFQIYEQAFKKILQTHIVVHIHPNNNDGMLVLNGLEIPRLLEFSFLRKDRFKESPISGQFPHEADQTNNPSKKDIKLPRIWYSD